jgi:hypothetical protein
MLWRLTSIAVALLLSLFVSGCFFGGGNTADGVRVRFGVLSGQVNEQGTPITISRVFPPNVSRISALVQFEGVKSGMQISGRWYQLGMLDRPPYSRNVPPDGQQVHNSQLRLSNSNVREGRATVSMILPAITFPTPSAANQPTPVAAQGIPEDSWLLRIYVQGTLVHTYSFVVTSATGPVPFGQQGANGGPAPGGQQPPAGAPPQATPTPTTYTVVAGDTLQSIATRFKPANEETNAYVTRLVQTNNLSGPTATLNVGQQLRIPR